MKSKKAFLPVLGLVYGAMIIVILILLVWFGFRISEGLSAMFNFLYKWWWAIALSITAITFRKQIIAIVNAILGRFGIKV